MKKAMENENSTNRISALGLLIKGLVVGYTATQALDKISIYLYDKEGQAARDKENAVRRGLHAYERAIKNQFEFLGIKLTRQEIKKWGWRFHRTFGILSGVGYLALRKKYPKLGAAMGLGFGTAFFILVDEVMLPALKLTPGPQAFDLKVHGRGAAAHIGYGIAAEGAARLVDGGLA
jgi:hypothetical protein